MQSPITAPTPAKITPVTTQPQAEGMRMTSLAPQNESVQEPGTHHHGPARRLRGGGAGKDCFLGMIGCFLCFECCEGCCECIADIVCCPCEMCC